MLLKFYADDSYNNRTFNLGGWLANETEWIRIEAQWTHRLEVERRRHGALSRYHASDCSNLKGEYADWTIKDQILHVQKLQSIITRREVGALCFGLDMTALTRLFERDKNNPLAAAYNLSVRKMMMLIYRLVKRHQGHRVAIIHDRTNGYDSLIQDAFNKLMDDESTMLRYNELFTTITPMRWQDCVPLQSADMIAFDAFKLIDSDLHTTSKRIRRSLLEIVGKGTPIAVRYFGEPQLRHLAEMMEKRTAGTTDL
jgi:hypothetical protein